MAWGRNEAANLLMVGAGIIAGIQTAIFGKWIDARIASASNMNKKIICKKIFWTFKMTSPVWGL